MLEHNIIFHTIMQRNCVSELVKAQQISRGFKVYASQSCQCCLYTVKLLENGKFNLSVMTYCYY